MALATVPPPCSCVCFFNNSIPSSINHLCAFKSVKGNNTTNIHQQLSLLIVAFLILFVFQTNVFILISIIEPYYNFLTFRSLQLQANTSACCWEYFCSALHECVYRSSQVVEELIKGYNFIAQVMHIQPECLTRIAQIPVVCKNTHRGKKFPMA